MICCLHEKQYRLEIFSRLEDLSAHLSKAILSQSLQSKLNPRLSALHILYWMIETTETL